MRSRAKGASFPVDDVPVEETYDLVVVGGGISGLAAAWFYRRARPSARILILDNHDDFGGHAKRNEFTLDGRRIIGYGGSQSLQSPNALYSPVAKGLLRDLGVDITRFETAFERDLYPSLGLSRGMFFNREAFGRDVLVTGDPGGGDGSARPQRQAARRIRVGFSDFGGEQGADRRALPSRNDPLAGKSRERKARDPEAHQLSRLPDEDLRLQRGGGELLSGPSARLLRARQRRGAGRRGARSRLSGLRRPEAARRAPTRLGRSPTSIISPTAMRRSRGCWCARSFPARRRATRWTTSCRRRSTTPRSTAAISRCASVSTRPAFMSARSARQGAGRLCARWRAPSRRGAPRGARLLPHDDPAHRAGIACTRSARRLRKNVKTPICYTNVLVRNWRAFANLKVNSISAPMGFHHQVSLDFPVSLGGYRHPRDPSEPMLLHLVHVPGAPNQGLDARAQFRIGQGKLYAMTFADFEERIRDDLDRMLGPGGFSSARDIAAITVNRWPHGYSYVANSLFDPDDYDDTVLKVARQPFGPRGDRQHRCRRRRLGALRDRSGRSGGEGTGGIIHPPVLCSSPRKRGPSFAAKTGSRFRRPLCIYH